MNTKFLKLITAILLFSFLTAGCQKDDIFEINIGSKNSVIEKTIDGIEFKFCLLNLRNKPATVFNEGENFIFSFSFRNTRDEKLNVDNSFLNNGIFEVFDNNNKSLGFPYIKDDILAADIGAGANPFTSGFQYELEVPWSDERESWGFLYYRFIGANNDFLPKGKYYTKFSSKFRFPRTVYESSILTDTLTFKINFQIK